MFEFFGIPYNITWTEELIADILPVVIVLGMVALFYMFLCFMVFLSKLFKFRRD